MLIRLKIFFYLKMLKKICFFGKLKMLLIFVPYKRNTLIYYVTIRTRFKRIPKQRR